MVHFPKSPSSSIPGAWPATPSPKCHIRQQERNVGDPHYMRSSQCTSALHYRKASLHRPTHPCINSRTIGPIWDNTLTSIASGDLSLQPSRANNSFSSAYTSPTTPDTSLSPKKPDEARQRGENETSLQKTTIRNNSTRKGDKESCPFLFDSLEAVEINTDQTFLSLPEIPDLASLSSLREEFQISRGQLSTPSSRSGPQLCLDESFFEAHTLSIQQDSFDTLSTSSIRFRQADSEPKDLLDFDTKPLRYPQPDGRDSWTLFLSPTSISSGDPPIPQVLPKSLASTLPTESECETMNLGSPAVRRSWQPSANHPCISRLGQEETSTTQYARDLLDRVFGVDGPKSNLVLSTPGAAGISPHSYSLLPMNAKRPEPVQNNSANVHSPHRAKILHTVQRIRQSVRRMLIKLAIKDHTPGQCQNNSTILQSSCQHLDQAPATRNVQRAFPTGPWRQSQCLNCPSATIYDTQAKQDRLHSRARSHVSSGNKTQWHSTSSIGSIGFPTHHGLINPHKLNAHNTHTPSTNLYGNHIPQTPTGCHKGPTSTSRYKPKRERLEYADKKPEKTNDKQRRSLLFRLSFQSDRKH